MGMGIGGGGSVIKSIQRGVTSFPADTTSIIDVTLTTVNLSKSHIAFGGSNFQSGNAYMPYATLTSSTNIRLQRPGTGFASDIAWEVIEYA